MMFSRDDDTGEIWCYRNEQAMVIRVTAEVVTPSYMGRLAILDKIIKCGKGWREISRWLKWPEVDWFGGCANYM